MEEGDCVTLIISKKLISLILIVACLALSMPALADEHPVLRFSDVPKGHFADKAVQDLRRLNITGGIGNNRFGLSLEIKRSEFVTYLVRLMQWEQVKPKIGSFRDNLDDTQWYYPYIETALIHHVITKSSDKFRPDEPITREEMAIMIVNTLGYDTLAQRLTHYSSPFDDVTNNTGYIIVARDFGIIHGVGGNQFKPDYTAKREEAAVMMMRMYEKLHQPINELHAFYAIRSYHQMDMISALNSVSFGWSRLEYDSFNEQIILNTSDDNGNEYAVPRGFSEPVLFAQQNNVSTQLMVFADHHTEVSVEEGRKVPLLEHILTQPELTQQAITAIVQQVNATTKDGATVSFDGVVIDFESMKGELLKQALNVFLEELKQALDQSAKKLYVVVHPKRKPEQAYYDGYDYKAIGKIADKVILMAHDYYAKKLTEDEMQNRYTITPLSPINEVYDALKSITDKDIGVEDLSKVWLQLSFDAVQWKEKDGKVMNQYPYHPTYETIYQRLLTDATMHYSNLNRNPYITFLDSSDETYNVLWYEDSRSVQEKIQLARLFGINGISLWRLGNVPDYEETDTKKQYLDVWQQILSNIEK